jgi:hypothetical protein
VKYTFPHVVTRYQVYRTSGWLSQTFVNALNRRSPRVSRFSPLTLPSPKHSAEGTITSIDQRVLLRPGTPHVEQFINYGHGLASAPDPLASSYISVSSVLLTPLSRGHVTLRGGAEHGEARIVVNQMKDEVDREMMVAALEGAYKILRSEAWREVLDTGSENGPCKEALLDTIKRRVTTRERSFSSACMRIESGF